MARPLSSVAPVAFKAIESNVTFVRFACATLLLLPALYGTMTFQPSPDFALSMRAFAIPVRTVEALIVLVAMRDGFAPLASFHGLNQFTKVAATVWVVSVVAATIFANYDQRTATVLAAGTLLHAVTALAIYDRLRIVGTARTLIVMAAWGLAGYAIVAVSCAVIVSHDPEFPWFYYGVGVTNVRQIAFYGLPLLGIALGLLCAEDEPKIPGQAFALLAIGIFLVCWSGGRAALGATLVAFGVALLLARAQLRARIAAHFALATACALPVVEAFSFSPLWGLGSLQRVVPEASVTSFDQYSSSRMQFWQWTWQDILAQPWIGHGEGQFAWMILSHTGKYFNHPHNAGLQMAYEWGVPGSCALVLLVGRIVWSLREIGWGAVRCLAPAACGFAGLAAMSLLEGTFYHAIPILYSLLFLACMAAQHSLSTQPGFREIS